MIWFTCRQCGKAHGRPESSVGSMIFCECGQGNTVPWESTIAAPETPSAPAQSSAPVAIPLQVEDELPQILPQVRRRSTRRQPDPAFCLNHETVPSQHKCPDCGEAFCADCVLTFQDTTLCGPCKNYRVRRMMRPPQLSGFALTSVLLALMTGPLIFCPFAVSSVSSLWGLLGLLPQLVAFGLGALALRTTETDAQRSGRSLAITGMVTAAVACVLTLLVTVFAQRPLG
jgi:hypothetical protein